MLSLDEVRRLVGEKMLRAAGYHPYTMVIRQPDKQGVILIATSQLRSY